MIYPQRDNRRKQKKIQTFVGTISFVIVLIIVLNIWKPQFLSSGVQALGRPVLEARGGFLGSVNNVWQFFHSKAVLVAENNDLNDKLALTNAIATERDYYKFENAEISKLADRIQEDKKTTFAKIISKPGFSPYDTMIIDGGTDQGIKAGDDVFASQDIILGKVSDAYAHSSTVILYSTADKETSVLIGSSSIQAVATGKGGGNFEIKIPQNAGVQIGDIIVMASSTTKIFGTIEHINTSVSDSFERALFKSPIDVTDLTFVTIEKK